MNTLRKYLEGVSEEIVSDLDQVMQHGFVKNPPQASDTSSTTTTDVAAGATSQAKSIASRPSTPSAVSSTEDETESTGEGCVLACHGRVLDIVQSHTRRRKPALAAVFSHVRM